MMAHQTANSPSADPPPLSLFQLWCKYEDVTMHFNDLIIRLRFQALAGVAGISALAGVLARDATQDARSMVLGGVFLLLAFFWMAIWLLDRLYYDKLLSGAVAALLKIERESDELGKPTQIDLSTLIEKSFVGDPIEFRKPCFLKDGRNWFYVVVLIALLGGSLLHFRPVLAHYIGQRTSIAHQYKGTVGQLESLTARPRSRKRTGQSQGSFRSWAQISAGNRAIYDHETLAPHFSLFHR